MPRSWFHHRVLSGLAAGALLSGVCVDARAQSGPSPSDGPLTLEAQGSFFVGGREVRSDTLSTLPAYAPSGTVSVDQMYVRYQVPAAVDGRPALVLIHGCCLTGKTWETTPDGRSGWDDYLLRKNYPVYVIDQASRGRSAANIAAINAVKTGTAPPDRLPTVFSAGHEPAWAIFRFGPEYPKVVPGMQYPLEAQAEFWKQMVPDWSGDLPTPNPTVPALSILAKRIGPAVLVSHSQAGIYPFQVAAAGRDGVAGIVALEPAACPAPTDDMTPYKGLPILVLFGDYVDQSPRWAPRLALCRQFVAAANAAGGKAELVLLPDVGIHGNSHMMMQDRNSHQVADWVAYWIERHVPKGT